MTTTAFVSATPAPRANPLDLSAVAFFGRSFAEYCRFFALDPTQLRRRPVLDVAAGPSSFTAEACRAGIDAVAVDTLYHAPPEHLAAKIQEDYSRMFRRLRERPELVRVERQSQESPNAYFPSIAAAEKDRRAAAQRFLEDYAAHAAHGRYFGASLPQLPFFDRAFDVVLCAHLLFVYANQFDYAFHLAACRELVRVSRDEVRIHPLCEADGSRYEHLDRLCEDLEGGGIAAKVISVDYEFFIGTDSTLVLTRSPA